MSHYKSELQEITKPPTEHPWAHHIKDQYSNRIKYSHNSIRNPTYPRKKDKTPPNLDRTQFTVIGDRITKEFIYCVKLIKGLHKYRKKSFDAPIIRGVSTVAWPSIWNDLKIRYGGLAYCLRSSVAVLLNDKIIGGEKELKELLQTKYTYHLSLNYHQEAVAEFAKFIRSSGRPCAYMNISIKGVHIGTFIFMLYSDIVPYTCENFLRLCREKRGGYSGTPIHRIVKDGWIQGGGFKLKNTNLGCENFIVPHDRRGLLCMANAGRHIKCSTQFFVLLQPAPWMDQKFVAFGELIEGKDTLDKIEAVPTFYESPTSEIMITKAGIFNMDCHDITINKGSNEYIDSHIEDLNALGELLYETLIENVFLTAQLREIERLREVGGEGGEQESEDEDTQHRSGKDGAASVRETQRFNRRKEDIEKQLETSKADKQTASRLPPSATRPTSETRQNSPKAQENNEFDVETYDPEYEETDYQHQTLPPPTPSLIVKPKKPYYLPLTDVPYPGERDSHFDLKRFLQGDYCHESDLQKYSGKGVLHQERLSFPSDLFNLNDGSETASEENSSLDSDDDKAVKRYLKANVDRVSFAGGIIRNIAKGAAKINIFDDRRKSELITDDALRRLRLASIDYRNFNMRDKKVSISIPNDTEHHMKIKRRQTGFVRPEDLERIHIFQKNVVRDDDEDDDDDNDNDDRDDDDDEDEEPCHRKVSISVPGLEHQSIKIKRRQTGFVRSEDLEKIHTFQKTALDDEDDDGDNDDDDDDDDDDNPRKVRIAASSEPTTGHHQITARRPTGYVRAEDIPEEADETEYRQSVLVRLLDDVKRPEEPPTLKDYKPMSESHQKNILLTFSPNYHIKSEENTKDKYLRRSVTIGAGSYEHVLNLQHGKKVARKVSSDYVKTLDQIEHVAENSIRSVEFAKIRPAISVSDYQKKNKKYRASMTGNLVGNRGLRLPGDSPLYHGSTEQDRKQSVL